MFIYITYIYIYIIIYIYISLSLSMFGSKIKMQNIYTPFDFKGSEPLFIASWFDFDHRNTVMESWMCTIWPHLWIDITNDADLPQTANATGTKLSDAMSLLSIYIYIYLIVCDHVISCRLCRMYEASNSADCFPSKSSLRTINLNFGPNGHTLFSTG